MPKSVPPCKVLLVHSRYRFPGGEESQVALEAELLKQHGHEVSVIEASGGHLSAAMGLLRVAPWLSPGRRSIKRALQRAQPDLIHIHNLWPHLGLGAMDDILDYVERRPSGHEVKVLLTIHNQRYICINGLYWQKGRPCTKCFDKRDPWWGWKDGCRSSQMESLLYAHALAQWQDHRFWKHPGVKVLALNDRTAHRLLALHPESKVSVLPNPVDTKAKKEGPIIELSAANRRFTRPYYFIASRLSEEKGIDRILTAVASSPRKPDEPLVVIAGDGPLRRDVEQGAAQNPDRLVYLGRIREEEVHHYLIHSLGALFTSVVEEQSPGFLRLAQALKVPVWRWDAQGLRPMDGADIEVWGPVLDFDSWYERWHDLVYDGSSK